MDVLNSVLLESDDSRDLKQECLLYAEKVVGCDLATENPQLAAEWHPTKNGASKPTEFTSNSSQKIWWKCERGHEWQAPISSRMRGTGCPYCKNRKVLAGYNDLATENPQLAAEWHPTKNGISKPTEFVSNTLKKVWWKCEKGHEWEASIHNRVAGTGCPYCKNKKVLAGYNDLATENPQLAAEWHPTKNGASKPTEFTSNSSQKIWWKCERGHEWQAPTSSRMRGTGCPYCKGRKAIKGCNDLATENPQLAAEWHPTKNGDLKPSDVKCQSGYKVWWKCERGHEWQAPIFNRMRGSRCPYCKGRKAIKGCNDLATVNPQLAAEWHPTRNGDLKPSDVKCHSKIKVWWKCEKGHEWKIEVGHRSRGDNCPYCWGRRAIKGCNDLATVNPQLAAEWHPTRNGDLKPSDVKCHSNIKVWWRCEKGHEWKIEVDHRSRGTGCPYCWGRRAIKGCNDLATENPQLAAEWHPTRNGDLKPSDVKCQSEIKVWWKCEKGHEWKIEVGHRSRGDKCPYCSNQKVLAGYNDLATVNPQLAAEWHPTKNRKLKPTGFTPHSGKKVWWMCEIGHEWRSTIDHRMNGRGCPMCIRKEEGT